MTAARFTLTFPDLGHDDANELASKLEEDFRLEPMAVTINETDETRGLWEVVLYFGALEEAEEASRLIGIATAHIAPVPDHDWVRQSLEGLAPVTAGRFFLYGAHDRHRRRELLQKGGLYASLWQRQSGGFLVEDDEMQAAE